jgi:hypothetical protein
MSDFGIEVRDTEDNSILFVARRVRSDKLNYLLAAFMASRADSTGEYTVKVGPLRRGDDA